MNPTDELRHLIDGPMPNEKIPGSGIVRFFASSSGPASESLSRVRQVMIACLSLPSEAISDQKVLRRELPSFFVERFAKEPLPEENEAFMRRWRAANDEERARLSASKKWSLSAWSYWMKPENRTWWWWDALVTSDERCAVALVVDGWPFPWEAFRVMMQNCGFSLVEPEE